MILLMECIMMSNVLQVIAIINYLIIIIYYVINVFFDLF